MTTQQYRTLVGMLAAVLTFLCIITMVLGYIAEAVD